MAYAASITDFTSQITALTQVNSRNVPKYTASYAINRNVTFTKIRKQKLTYSKFKNHTNQLFFKF
jgi:hypothetical protein